MTEETLAITLAKIQYRYNKAMTELAEPGGNNWDYQLFKTYLALEEYLMDDEIETVSGTLIDERTVPDRDSDFQQASLNSLDFKNLESGTYKLVKTD